LECIGSKSILDRQSIKYLASIIIKKGSDLDKSSIKNLFNIILLQGKLHEREILWQSFKLFSDRPKDLKITDKAFNQIKAIVFDKCEVCDRKHEDMIIINLWQFAKKFRPEIESHIHNRIQNGTDSELHYQAIVSDIIPFDQKIIDKLVPRSISTSNPVGSRIFGHSANNNFNFLQLIHLVFKYKVDTKTKQFDKIRELGDYYQWLLDPENFDYQFFNSDWLFNIYITDILNKLKDISEMKKILLRDLKENPNHKQLMHAFIRLHKE
jgi:hypothetical protein